MLALTPRRGKNKAIIAVAHHLLRSAYYILLKRQPYKDLSANYLDKQGKEQSLTRLCHQIKQLGASGESTTLGSHVIVMLKNAS